MAADVRAAPRGGKTKGVVELFGRPLLMAGMNQLGTHRGCRLQVVLSPIGPPARRGLAGEVSYPVLLAGHAAGDIHGARSAG